MSTDKGKSNFIEHPKGKQDFDADAQSLLKMADQALNASDPKSDPRLHLIHDYLAKMTPFEREGITNCWKTDERAARYLKMAGAAPEPQALPIPYIELDKNNDLQSVTFLSQKNGKVAEISLSDKNTNEQPGTKEFRRADGSFIVAKFDGQNRILEVRTPEHHVFRRREDGSYDVSEPDGDTLRVWNLKIGGDGSLTFDAKVDGVDSEMVEHANNEGNFVLDKYKRLDGTPYQESTEIKHPDHLRAEIVTAEYLGGQRIGLEDQSIAWSGEIKVKTVTENCVVTADKNVVVIEPMEKGEAKGRLQYLLELNQNGDPIGAKLIATLPNGTIRKMHVNQKEIKDVLVDPTALEIRWGEGPNGFRVQVPKPEPER